MYICTKIFNFLQLKNHYIKIFFKEKKIYILYKIEKSTTQETSCNSCKYLQFFGVSCHSFVREMNHKSKNSFLSVLSYVRIAIL